MTTTCSWTAPGTFPPVYCQLPDNHTGWHQGTDGSEWITSEDVHRGDAVVHGEIAPTSATQIERLETGIAAAVHEIDELRAENTRLRKLIAGVGAALGVHITIAE